MGAPPCRPGFIELEVWDKGDMGRDRTENFVCETRELERLRSRDAFRLCCPLLVVVVVGAVVTPYYSSIST